MSKKVWLVIAVAILILAGMACVDDNDDNVVIEPDRLEYLITPTPPTFTTTDATADDVVEAVLKGWLTVDEGLSLIAGINCRLGFSTCLTVTSVVTPTVDLWGSD